MYVPSRVRRMWEENKSGDRNDCAKFTNQERESSQWTTQFGYLTLVWLSPNQKTMFVNCLRQFGAAMFLLLSSARTRLSAGIG
jgi:hypothetical protein